MIALGSIKTDVFERNAARRQNAHIGKAVVPECFCIRFVLGEYRTCFGKQLCGRVIEMIEVKVSHNHGVYIE